MPFKCLFPFRYPLLFSPSTFLPCPPFLDPRPYPTPILVVPMPPPLFLVVLMSPPVTRCHPSLPHLPLCTLVHPPTRLPTHSPTLFYLLTYRTEPPSPLFMVPPFYSIPSVFHMFPFCVLVTLHIISHHISILYFPLFFLFFPFDLFSFSSFCSPFSRSPFQPPFFLFSEVSVSFCVSYPLLTPPMNDGRARDRGLVSCVYVCIPFPFFSFHFLFVSFFLFFWLLDMLFDCVILHTSQTPFSFLHAYIPEDTETGRQRRRDSEVGRQMERGGGRWEEREKGKGSVGILL